MSKVGNKSSTSRVSLHRKQYRILDEANRNRRIRQQVEQLERDNFHEDPHANLVMHKKAPKFEDVNNRNSKSTTPSTLKRYSNRSTRPFTLNMLIEENSKQPSPNYLTILTRPLKQSPTNVPISLYLANNLLYVLKRYFCSVCGFTGNYTCVVCGMRYCSTNCHQTHVDTRCLKWAD